MSVTFTLASHERNMRTAEDKQCEYGCVATEVVSRVSHLAKGSRFLIAEPYRHLMSTINPNAFVFSYSHNNPHSEDGPATTFVFDFFKKIFPSEQPAPSMSEKAASFIGLSDKKPPLTPFERIKPHFTLRLSFALLAVSTAIARVVDAIIGIIAAVFSVIALGTSSLLNRLAYIGFQTPALIGDLLFDAIKIINPWAAEPQNKVS